jgi:hypothetical protein
MGIGGNYERKITPIRPNITRAGIAWGRCGAAFGAVVAVLGICTAITMERFNMVQLHRHRVPMILLVTFSDIVVFAVSFALAVYWRRNREFHRRLMLVSSSACRKCHSVEGAW